MKKFEYIVKDELGIHARPAGLLIKEAKNMKVRLFFPKREKRQRQRN